MLNFLDFMPSRVNRVLEQEAMRFPFLIASRCHPEDLALFYSAAVKNGLRLMEDYVFHFENPHDHHLMLLVARSGAKAYDEYIEISRRLSMYQSALFELHSIGIKQPTEGQLLAALEAARFPQGFCSKCLDPLLKAGLSREDALMELFRRGVDPSPRTWKRSYNPETGGLTVTVEFGCGHHRQQTFDLRP
jgi:hypothetical protein